MTTHALDYNPTGEPADSNEAAPAGKAIPGRGLDRNPQQRETTLSETVIDYTTTAESAGVNEAASARDAHPEPRPEPQPHLVKRCDLATTVIDHDELTPTSDVFHPDYCFNPAVADEGDTHEEIYVHARRYVEIEMGRQKIRLSIAEARSLCRALAAECDLLDAHSATTSAIADAS